MSDKSSKTGMKFRRLIYRLGKYSMFVFTVITCYNLTSHLLELRSEKMKRERNKRTAIAVSSVVVLLSIGLISQSSSLANSLETAKLCPLPEKQ